MNKAAAVAVAAVVGVAGVVLASFAWTGRAVVGQLQEQTTQLSKLSPAFKLVDEKVERGLFHSRYEATLRLGCLPALPRVPGGPALPIEAGQPLEIGVRTEVRHGPLLPRGVGIAVLDSVLLVPEMMRARVDALTDKKPPLRVQTTIGFARSFRSEFTVPAVHFSDPTAGSFQIDAVRGEFTGDVYDSARGGNYTFDLPGFALRTQAPDAAIDLKVGRMHSETKLDARKDPAVWLMGSQATGSIADVTLTASAPSTLGGAPSVLKMGMPALKFEQRTKLDKGLFESTISYRGQGSFNGFKVDSVELKGGLRRVDAVGYQKLLTHLFEAAFSCDPDAQGKLAAAFPALEREAVALLVHDPEYALDALAIELDGQRGELSYAVGTEGVKPADLSRPLLDLAMQHGVVRAHARLQLGLLDAIDRRLAAGKPAAPAGAGPLRSLADFAVMQFGEAGYLVQTGDALETTLSYRKGELLLNGKTPALPDLGSLLGGK